MKNEHWFFDLLKILYEADQEGVGLSWENFTESLDSSKPIDDYSNLKKIKNNDYLKNIFFDVSESIEEIKSDSKKKDPNEKSNRHLKTKMYERYIGYLELKGANESSRQSERLANKSLEKANDAICVAVILGFLSLAASGINIIYSHQQLKIAKYQISKKIELSEDIEKIIINIGNSSRSSERILKKPIHQNNK